MTNRTISSRHAVRSQTVLLLTLALVAALFVHRPAFAQSEGGTGLGAEAQKILDDVNQARIDNGLPALALSPSLTLAAQRHVDDIIANGNWGHYGSDGSNVRLRAARVGYPTGHVSENWVAVNSPEKAIVWWMNDWIHRVNILQGHWDEIGVGAAQAGNGYWIFVTDFGNIDGNAMPPVVESAVTNLTYTDTGGAVEALPENGEYRIQGGDTLLGIAIRYGLDWQDIALANNMGEDELLQIGRVIRLPMLAGTGGPAASAELEIVAGKQTHAIRPGETLWTIAARYKITWQEVAAVNGLGEYDLLQIGDELKLPASLDEPDEAEEQAAAEATGEGGEASSANQDAERREEGARFIQSVAPAANAAPAPSRFSYTVKAGDTLLAIAINHDLAWETLAEANNLDGDSFLQIGQELVIPGATATFTQASADAAPEEAVAATGAGAAGPGRVHRIQSGDTVFGVALQYGLDWQELLRLNGLDEKSLLQPGQELQLP